MSHILLHRLLSAEILAGRMQGLAAIPDLEREAREAPYGSVVLLDLSGIEVLTSSYFLASIWAVFWASTLIDDRDLYPVLVNVPNEVAEEIEIALRANGAPAVFAKFSEEGFAVRPFNLDPFGEQTLARVRAAGSATASDLHSQESQIGKTAWSNRLAQLHKQRILRREKLGRQLVYSASWEGVG